MAERYLFFNALETSPGVYDREYQAQDFAEYFASVLSTGVLHTNNSPGLQVTVEPGTLNTIVDVGRAILKGHYYENTTPLTLTHAIPEPTLDRIDRIVLRLNRNNSERWIKLMVLSGEPADNPLAPELVRTKFIHDISLAQVLVRANTVQLLPGDLIDERLDEEVCGTVSSLITVPTNVFNQQFKAWLDENQTGFDDWFAVNRQAFVAWFENIRGILDENVAGNLLLLIQKNESDIKSLIKTKNNILIPASGWTSNAGTGRYEYQIDDMDITADSVVDVNIQLDYLDYARMMMSACVSGDGHVTLYSTDLLDNDLVVDYRITRQVI